MRPFQHRDDFSFIMGLYLREKCMQDPVAKNWGEILWPGAGGLSWHLQVLKSFKLIPKSGKHWHLFQAFLPSPRKLDGEKETNHKWFYTSDFVVLHWPHFMPQELPQVAVAGFLQRVWWKTRPGNCLHSASLGFAATAKGSQKKNCCSQRGIRVPKIRAEMLFDWSLTL